MSRIETQPPQQPAAPGGTALGTFDMPFAANMALNDIASQIAQEMMDFTNRRLQAQVEFLSSMPQHGDLGGLIEAQFRFLEKASRDYAEEISHVSEVIRKAAVAQRAAKG